PRPAHSASADRHHRRPHHRDAAHQLRHPEHRGAGAAQPRGAPSQLHQRNRTMKNSTLFGLATLALVGVVADNCLYVVREYERAVLLTFGEVTNANVTPGLHFKIPAVLAVRKFAGRMQTLSIDTHSGLALVREYLEVDSFAKWRIGD